MQGIGRYGDVSDGTADVNRAGCGCPALHLLAGWGDQITLGIQVEASCARVQLISGGIAHNEESISLNGGIECASGELQRALCETSLRGGCGYTAANLNSAASNGLREQIAKGQIAGLITGGVQIRKIVAHDIERRGIGRKPAQCY